MLIKTAKKYILAVDHGTSGVKTALVSVYGKVLGWEFEKTPLILLPGGGAEQDPDLWWTAFLTTAKRLVSQHLVPTEDIIAVCLSAQWSCTIPLDKDGKHLMNAISWMDSRGAPYISKLVRGLLNISGYAVRKLIRWLSRTGGAPTRSGKDPIAHIIFIREELPEIYQKTYKFLDAKDYLNYKLTGKFAASFDSNHLLWSIDARDLNNVQYDQKLLDFMGLDREKLPDMIRPTDVLGPLLPVVAKEIGLGDHVKVVSGSPDLQMAAIGSGAVEDYQGHVYIGTSAFLICHAPKQMTDIFHNMGALPSANPAKYMVTSEQESAGACLTTFLRDKIVFFHSKEDPPHSYEELDEIAMSVPAGSNGLIFTPWLYGERTPIDDHTVRGGFHNLSLSNDLNDAVRAVFEGVAFNARWVLKYMEKMIKRKMDPINIIGGGAVSDVWCQIYADIFNRTIRRVTDPIYANARAAFVASVGLGFIKFEDIPELTTYSGTFHPNPENREIYDKLFKEFVQIYEKNKKIYNRLNS